MAYSNRDGKPISKIEAYLKFSQNYVHIGLGDEAREHLQLELFHEGRIRGADEERLEERIEHILNGAHIDRIFTAIVDHFE